MPDPAIPLDRRLPVVVIGAGPVGLVAAVHLLNNGLQPVILEAGDEPAAAIKHWAHVRLFSPWKDNIDPAAGHLLSGQGWDPPDPESFPTGEQLRSRFLLPLSDVPELRARIMFNARVTGVRRRRIELDGDRAADEAAPFEIRWEGRQPGSLLAAAVIDASGTFYQPNPLGASGVPARGEAELAGRVAYGVPDVLGQRRRYLGRRVLVVGSGHSAMTVLTDLARLHPLDPRTRIVWGVRGNSPPGVTKTSGDQLSAMLQLEESVLRLVEEEVIELGTGIVIEELVLSSTGIVARHAGGEVGPVDQIVAATGFRPDLEPLKGLRLALDPILEAPLGLVPLIDPRTHSCSSVPVHGATQLAHPEPGFYLAGIKSYGRASTFLLRTGYHQARSIAEALAGGSLLADARGTRGDVTAPAGNERG